MDNVPTWVTQAGMSLGLVLLALLAYLITVRVMRNVVRSIAKRTSSTWDDRIIERKVLSRLAYALPAMIISGGIVRALGLTPAEAAEAATTLAVTALVVQRVSFAVVILSGALAVSALLDAINDIYQESYSEAKSRPIKGYLQVLGLAVYIGATVIMISIVADRSPIVFLSGLGALTAVLMLVFRDTILSLVASMQIMSNDMIRIGDWVEMPQANTDGDVIDIALHTVKVQNWDKTISTIPTHKFISESFKNWRGMSESGGRRIKRAVHLDLSTVHFLTDDEVEHLSRYELLREYMAGKRAKLAEYEAATSDSGEVIPDPRHLTNVGTFRAYAVEYLKANPFVHDDMTLLVRQLAPSPKGLPIEIYCFTNDTAWATYESVQGDIFDHLIPILPEFGLQPFQEPAGTDFGRISMASAGGQEVAEG